MAKLTTSAARKNLAEALNRVAFGGERIVLHRRGKAVAALIPVDDLALLEEIEDRMDVAAARKAIAEKSRPLPWEEYKRRRGA